MGRCELTLDGRAIGRAGWQAQGGGLLFWARCPFEEEYIYRVGVRTAGQTLFLGVMMPEAGDFTLRKTLRAAQARLLAEAGEGRVEAWVVRTRPGEDPVHTPPRAPRGAFGPAGPELSTGDRLLDRAAASADQALYRREGGLVQVAFPFEPGKPTPAASFFSVMALIRLEGREYGLITCGEKGILCPEGEEYYQNPGPQTDSFL